MNLFFLYFCTTKQLFVKPSFINLTTIFMRRKLLSILLLALVCLAGGSVAVMAQTPEPTAKWTFSNTEDLMAPSVGNLTMTPCVIPANKTIAVSNVSDAGIVTADGPADGVPAIAVP